MRISRGLDVAPFSRRAQLPKATSMLEGDARRSVTDPLVIGIVADHAFISGSIASVAARRGHRVVEISPTPFDVMRRQALSCEVVVVIAAGLARNGRRLVRSLCSTHPNIRIVMVDDSHCHHEAERSLLAGAAAVIGCRTETNASIDLIEAAARGDSIIGTTAPLPATTAGAWRSSITRTASSSRHEANHELLSARETEILQLAVDGMSITDTAERLFISPKTVKHHLSSIYAKLGATNRTDALIRALRAGLVDLGDS